MQLENYFDFINENAIRIKGHRIGIEHVLRDYCEGASPEELLLRYPTLSLEKNPCDDYLLFGKQGGNRGLYETGRRYAKGSVASASAKPTRICQPIA